MAEIEDYSWLTGPEAASLLTEFAEQEAPALQLLGRLRKVLSPERSRLLVEQLTLRRRATVKFGTLAKHLFFTDLGLQQSTDRWIAHYKASRLPQTEKVLDFCCGIGGDLLAFAEQSPTSGWDNSPEVACLAIANLKVANLSSGSEVQIGNVEEQTPDPGEIWHLDPDRRVEGRRSSQIQWHSPGPEVVDRWLELAPQGILKLAPAAVVPKPWQCQAELEWISRDRECRQLVVWFGNLACSPGTQRATILKKSNEKDSSATPHTFQGNPEVAAPCARDLLQYVYEFDPAIRAASLSGAFAVENELAALAPGSAYFTSDRAVDHPLLSCFEVIDHLPLRIGPLKNHLQSLGIGRLEIKKRGVKIDPEQLRKQLKLRGNNAATLLLGQIGPREVAILAKRHTPKPYAIG